MLRIRAVDHKQTHLGQLNKPATPTTTTQEQRAQQLQIPLGARIPATATAAAAKAKAIKSFWAKLAVNQVILIQYQVTALLCPTVPRSGPLVPHSYRESGPQRVATTMASADVAVLDKLVPVAIGWRTVYGVEEGIDFVYLQWQIIHLLAGPHNTNSNRSRNRNRHKDRDRYRDRAEVCSAPRELALICKFDFG